MNKKEIAELRRHLSLEKHNITCLRGCYVNEKKEIISTFQNSLTLMGEEETEKFLSLFKKAMSGVQNKNLIDIAFSTSQVEKGEEHQLLTALRSSALKDEEAVKALYDKIIAALTVQGNYLILLMADTYDVPVRRRDGLTSGESDSQFPFIMCCICPVKLSKSALGFVAAQNEFRSTGSDQLVSSPELGFLFPAFDGRRTNLYSALYYTRNSGESHKEFTDAVFCAEIPKPADEQKDSFRALLAETLAEECSYEVIQRVHTQLSEQIAEHDADKTDDEPLFVTKGDVRAMLEGCGISDEKLNSFSQRFDETFGAGEDLIPQNIIDRGRFEIKTEHAAIKMAPELSSAVQMRVIDGVKYILIPADEATEAGGIHITIPKE